MRLERESSKRCWKWLFYRYRNLMAVSCTGYGHLDLTGGLGWLEIILPNQRIDAFILKPM
jgi:hypothetical protein